MVLERMVLENEKVIVAVGSTRGPKVNAVREALALIGSQLHPDAVFEVAPVESPSGVSHTPLSREEMMAGARNRAQALVQIARERNEPWKYFVGLEGGLEIVGEGSDRVAFLENWACVMDAGERVSFGRSGAVALPDSLAKSVVDDRVELSEAMDAFTGAHGIRDRQGAWGVLTNNAITRQDAFRTAIISAFAPFFNPTAYK